MSILGTAVSGLLAYQRALATTGHNIANASTQGYSRQRVELEARSPQMLGGNYIGQGVELSAVRRLQSDLVDAQLRRSLSDFNYGETRAAFSERMDRLLADDSTGLEPVLESYFNAVQDVASDPTSIPARTVMLNEAETFVERLSQLHGQIEEQRTLLNGSIETTVAEINQYSKSLADLNALALLGENVDSARIEYMQVSHTDDKNTEIDKTLIDEFINLDSPYPVVSKGSTDTETVKLLQQKLNENGAGLAEDGIFGNKTRAALTAYQEANGLVASGVCGYATWNALIGD